MSSRVRGQEFLTDISSLVDRVTTLELVTFGDENSAPPVQDSFSVGSISVPLSSSLSASASAFVPSAQSAYISESIADLFVATRHVYVTPLAERLRGGAPSGNEQNSESVEMVIIKTEYQFLAPWATSSEDDREAFKLEQTSNPEQGVVNEALKKTNLTNNQYLNLMAQQLN